MSTEACKPEDYKYIAAWGRHVGSQPYYIKAAQERAAEDHAPADALYEQVDGTWLCRSDLAGGYSRLALVLDRLVERMEQGG